MEAVPRALDASALPQAQATPAPPTVACLRCRDQKLRCDRELPSCERCRRQKATCTYPTPPDRKRIAQRTNRAKALQPVAVEEEAVRSSLISSRSRSSPVAVQSTKRPRLIEETPCKARSSREFDQTHGAELPSTEIGLLLLEVYFKRIYNATLLFHKSIAFQMYMQDGIPGYLLRAIFAHAAIFLKDVDESPHREHIKTLSMPTLHSKSWSWARSASVEILAHVDEPSLIRIQALQVLQLYYFSQGERDRAIVHASLAYRLSQLLGYDKLHDQTTSRGLQFDREIKRRSFWASWCSFIIGSNQLDPSHVFERVANLPLPAKFNKGGSIQGVELSRSGHMDRNWNPGTESSVGLDASVSLMAELVKLLGIWTKIQAFNTKRSMISRVQQNDDFEAIENLLDRFERSMHMPINDLCSRAEAYHESPELLASICTMLHLSRLLLHASMVPFLSGSHSQSSISRDLVSEHVKIVLEQAVAYSKLLQELVTSDLDITRLWPMTGYGAFMVGSVFIVLRNVSQYTWPDITSLAIPYTDSEEMNTVRIVLDVLSIYWQPLRKLANKLNNAVASGQHSGRSWATSSTYPGYDFEGGRDDSDTFSCPDLGNVSTTTPFVEAPVEGQSDHDRSTGEEQSLARDCNMTQARMTTDVSMAQATNASDEFASFDFALANGHKDGIFDAGWWNNGTAMEGWDYPSADMANSNTML